MGFWSFSLSDLYSFVPIQSRFAALFLLIHPLVCPLRQIFVYHTGIPPGKSHGKPHLNLRDIFRQ